jgi:hypothetical protein
MRKPGAGSRSGPGSALPFSGLSSLWKAEFKEQSMERAAIPIAGLLFALVAGWALYTFNPNIPGFFPECPVNSLSGFYCPGCGTLRSLHFLLHGQFIQAISHNVLMILSIPVLTWMAFRPSWVQNPAAPWAAFGIIVAYTVARNLPLWPFSMLAPGVA